MAEDHIVIVVPDEDVDVVLHLRPFTKFLSTGVQFMLWMIYSIFNPPPPPQPLVEPPPVQALRFHPIIFMIRNQELGKSVLNLATPLAIAMLFSSSGKSHAVSVHYVLTGLSIGCVAIFNGIVFRETIPRTANVVEQVGIITIFISFNGLLASALPMEFAWVPMLCAGFCLLPFIIASLPQPQPQPQPQDNNINDE